MSHMANDKHNETPDAARGAFSPRDDDRIYGHEHAVTDDQVTYEGEAQHGREPAGVERSSEDINASIPPLSEQGDHEGPVVDLDSTSVEVEVEDGEQSTDQYISVIDGRPESLETGTAGDGTVANDTTTRNDTTGTDATGDRDLTGERSHADLTDERPQQAGRETGRPEEDHLTDERQPDERV